MNELKKEKIKQLAKFIFDEIEQDLRDRRGIKHTWDSIDEDIQQEIRDTNIKNIEKILIEVENE
jgi:hypothetical protein